MARIVHLQQEFVRIDVNGDGDDDLVKGFGNIDAEFDIVTPRTQTILPGSIIKIKLLCNLYWNRHTHSANTIEQARRRTASRIATLNSRSITRSAQ